MVTIETAVVCCAPLAAPVLGEEQAAATAQLFKALADPARVRIVNALASANEPVCACDGPHEAGEFVDDRAPSALVTGGGPLRNARHACRRHPLTRARDGTHEPQRRRGSQDMFAS